MLSFMRKHARSWFIKVLLGTVIVVFVAFYGFNLSERESTLIVSVNDAKITVKEFQAYLERLLDAQRARSSELSREQLRALKETALEHLIDRALLEAQAERWKVSVAEAEVKEYIRNIRDFQVDGRFSVARYQQYLRFRNQAEQDFLREMRRSLVLQKTEDLIRDGAKVGEDEVDALYRLLNDRIVIEYVAVGPEPFLKEMAPSPDEVQSFFKERMAEYRVPETVKVAFLRFDPKAYADQVQVSSKELEDRYKATQDRWKEAKQVLARQIFLNSAEQDDPKARMKVLQKAEDLVKRLQGGEDFAKLAKEHSQDAQTATKGGSLGWKRQGELPEALDKALFEEMSPGQLTERPIKSPEGFHILRLEEVRSERIKPLEEVRETLERELRQDKARGKASELAEEAYRAIFTGGEFRDVAKRFQISPEQTQPFSLSGPRKDLPMGDAFRKAAFSLKQKGDFSDVVEDGGVFYILDLLDRWPSREPQFDEVQDKAREDLKRLKASERAAQEAQAFLQKVREGKVAFSDGAAQAGWKVQTSPSLNRISPLPGLPPEMIQAAFSLPKDTMLLPEPYPQGDRFLVAEIKERLPADPKGLEEQRPLYRSILLRDQRESQYREWLEMLRARSEIRMHRAYQDVL